MPQFFDPFADVRAREEETKGDSSTYFRDMGLIDCPGMENGSGYREDDVMTLNHNVLRSPSPLFYPLLASTIKKS